MRFRTAKIILSLLILMFIIGCSAVKKVPDGEYLLTKNEFEYKGKEKPFSSNLPDYVKQKPNASLLGFLPLKLMLYNSVNPKFDTTFIEYNDLSKLRKNRRALDSLLVKNGLEEYKGRSLWLKRFIFNQGEPPVLLDSSMSDFSAENLENYFFDRGYFDAVVKSSSKTDSLDKKAKVKYTVETGEMSIINSYNYQIKDSVLQKDYERMLSWAPNIKVGQRYDMDNFVAERDRIVNYLKNRGYWRFNDDGQAIEFTADTTQTDKSLDITLLIPVEKDSIFVKQKFAKYRYGEIHIYPDSDPVKKGQTRPEYYDTIYDGYHLHYVNPKMKYRPRFFTDGIVFKERDLYQINQNTQTRRNISKREGVTMTVFDESRDSTRVIQGDSVLYHEMYFRPKKKYDFFYGAELSWSEFMNFGVSPRVSLVARNLFKGGENLETTLRGTLGNVNRRFSDANGFFNAFEMSFQSKLTFPYLMFPLKTGKVFPKRFYKQTDLRVGSSLQRNIGLGRVTYSTGFDYNLSLRDTHSHMFSIFNTEFVSNLQKDNYFTVFDGDNNIKNNFFDNYYFIYNPTAAIQHFNGMLSDDEVIEMALNDQQFLQSLDSQGLESLSVFENMNFRKQTITQNVLISSLIYQYTLNQSEKSWLKNPWFFRGRIELAGNLLSILDHAFGFEKVKSSTGEEMGTVFSIPYSQFVKLDVDLRKYLSVGPKSTIAGRLFVGAVLPYGNTDFIPFVRSYTAGGANDIRAWAPATLGPAGIPRYEGGDDVFAIDQLKILMNAEYRFNVSGRINGALFVDAGNIWGIDKKDELSRFKFGNFFNELGIGAGYGFRFDFTYFLLRLDLAYKMHDPSYLQGNRWRFRDFNLFKPRLAFGINYPF